MRALICFFVALVSVSTHALNLLEGESHWSAGSGIVGRLNEDVNPKMSDTSVLPQFYFQFAKGQLAASLEGDWQEKETSTGAFSVTSRTFSLGLWGRYQVEKSNGLVPFVGGGAGSYFDIITSRYQEEEDRRNGRRGFFGVGGGAGFKRWKYLLLEAEIKAALIQDRKDIAYSGIFRLGFYL